MCGEHVKPIRVLCAREGSSPHVRGARLGRIGRSVGGGIIPACAGSTRRPSGQRRRPRDHPRMCGEHTCEAAKRHRLTGSSPHVRGALCVSDHEGVDLGIIPACAGSTWSVLSPLNACGDHPRMCGEHGRRRESSVARRGSSPHVRGALCVVRTVSRLPGIIPACAGSTRCIRKTRSDVWDHPRMCGEHCRNLTMTPISPGSSPHVRGAHRPWLAI